MDSKHTPIESLKINGIQLISQIEQLGLIGMDLPSQGRTRIALTGAEKLGRDLVVSWMKELDLDVTIDRVGNILGTLAAKPGCEGNGTIMMGSHIDTATNAGALDGCYGVLSGLAVIRSFNDAGIKPNFNITVAAFTNEEGVRYQPDMMGSLAYSGSISVDTVLKTRGTDGTVFGEELERIGYAGTESVGAIVPKFYLELHIEQGPILESENLDIGVVTDLQGISWQKVTIEGKANHAGTTPIHLRADAGFAAASVVSFLREYTKDNPTTLATVGSLNLKPNVINVIPRYAELTIDIRDPDERRLRNAEQALSMYMKTLESDEGVSIHSEVLARFEPVKFDNFLAEKIKQSAVSRNLSYRLMTSGAGHDAQMISKIAPSAMIFVPSRGGVSHNPAEYTENTQLLQGAEVLLETLCRVMFD